MLPAKTVLEYGAQETSPTGPSKSNMNNGELQLQVKQSLQSYIFVTNISWMTMIYSSLAMTFYLMSQTLTTHSAAQVMKMVVM